MLPSDYAERILLVMSGLSPQIITETVFALSQASPPFVPTQVHVLTTSEGAREARLTLFGKGHDWFGRLCREYGLHGIAFDELCIHEVRGPDGQALADIRSEADNQICADFIAGWVRQLTASPSAALHVSIAGGRKTMGFIAGYALSLYGRSQDRLSHVLVSEPFENNRAFFFPTRTSEPIALNNGRHADAQDARVTLADIPFVPLRHGLPEALLAGQGTYLDAVSSAREAFGPPGLMLDTGIREIVADGVRLRLSPWAFCLMAAFALRTQQGRAPLRPPLLKDEHNPEWAQAFRIDLEACFGRLGIPGGVEDSLAAECSGQKIYENVSRLRGKLRGALGSRAALYLAASGYTVPVAAQDVVFRREGRDFVPGRSALGG
jgi:CRISPR-associated protein (TIGR02584 family)